MCTLRGGSTAQGRLNWRDAQPLQAQARGGVGEGTERELPRHWVLQRDRNPGELKRLGGRSPEKVREYIVRFIVSHSEPYRTVEDKYFQDLLFLCGLESKVPGRETIRTNVLKWHAELEGKLKGWIGEHVPGKVSLTFDNWTSPNRMPFLTSQIHWIDDMWQKRNLTLAFYPLKGRHTGEVLVKVLTELVELYGIGPRLHCITSDNGSDCLKALRLSRKISGGVAIWV